MSNNNSTQRGLIYLGLDVAKDSIAVGVLRPDEVVPDTEKKGSVTYVGHARSQSENADKHARGCRRFCYDTTRSTETGRPGHNVMRAG